MHPGIYLPNMAGEDWSQTENEAIVSDYLAMLDAELSGLRPNKTEHRRNLQKLLNDRSEGSVEFKHCNISAVMIELGFPYISGYKPRWNFQKGTLTATVTEHLKARQGLIAKVAADAEQIPVIPTVDDILKVLTDPPKPKEKAEAIVKERSPVYAPRFVDYIAREARNRDLGLLGEEFVLRFEQARLIRMGHETLAVKIEHTSKLRGDGDGFDILSFETSGKERLIEVKTTKYGIETPFYVSRNEASVSRNSSDRYHLYRLYSFRETPKLFILPGALDSTCILEPELYSATVA